MSKPAEVRFYFDADILGLAKVVCGLRSDATYPGDTGAVIKNRHRPPCPIPRDAKDTEWLPAVSERGWLVITRDKAIQRHRAELLAVRESGARMVTLAAADARGTFEQLEVLMRQWRAVEDLASQAGPFIYTAARTALTKVADV